MEHKTQQRVSRKAVAIAQAELRQKALAELSQWARTGELVMFAFNEPLYMVGIQGRLYRRPEEQAESFFFRSLDDVFYAAFVIDAHVSVEFGDQDGRNSVIVSDDRKTFVLMNWRPDLDVAGILKMTGGRPI